MRLLVCTLTSAPGVCESLTACTTPCLEWVVHNTKLAAAPAAYGPPHAGWQSWLWYILAKLFHVTPHVGDPASDATRVLVSSASACREGARGCFCYTGGKRVLALW